MIESIRPVMWMAALWMGGFSPWDHTLGVWMWSWWNWEKQLLVKVLGPGALGRPRGIGWRGRWEGGSGWGIHVYPWLIHVYVWQKPLQYCKVISLQLIYIYIHIYHNKIWALVRPVCHCIIDSSPLELLITVVLVRLQFQWYFHLLETLALFTISDLWS